MDGAKIDPAVKELTTGFKQTTIQRSWSFIVDFLDNEYADLIPAYKICGVSLPHMTLSSDSLYTTSLPQAYPTSAETTAFQYSFSVIDDHEGSARTLAQHLYSRIRKPNGLYYPPSQAKFIGQSIKILDYSGHVVDMYHVLDILYQSVEPIRFEHEGNELIKHEFTCVADVITRI